MLFHMQDLAVVAVVGLEEAAEALDHPMEDLKAVHLAAAAVVLETDQVLIRKW